jgi:hypothetical protein
MDRFLLGITGYYQRKPRIRKQTSRKKEGTRDRQADIRKNQTDVIL